MNQCVKTMMTGLGLLALAGQTTALATVLMSLEPVSQTIQKNQSAQLDVMISNIPDNQAVGAFDLTLKYDGSILTATDFDFGTDLDLGIFGSTQDLDLTKPGVFALEVSLEESAALLAAQPKSFRLGTITFKGIGEGTSPIGLDLAHPSTLSDQDAISIPFDFVGARITVEGSSGVPDGGSALALLLPALFGLGLIRQARR